MSLVSKPKYIIAHFDAHGVSTASARARTLGVSPSNVVARFPHTGPEGLPNLIDTMFPTLVQSDVEIIDIPVNLKDPRTWIDVINRLARNTSVTIYDHHATDYKYASEIQARMIVFPDAVKMAQALVNENELRLAYIGVVADRDQSILQVVSRQEVEEYYLPLANVLDVLVRRDTQGTLQNLIANGISWLEQQRTEIDYPPTRLVDQVTIVRRGLNTILVNATGIDARTWGMWGWKTMEQVALRHGMDYVVAIAQVVDRQTQQIIPVVQVVKYWLSERPSPRPTIQPVLGRQTIGHDDAFSVRALDLNDARQLAETIFNELEAMTPRTARLISEKYVAEALRYDYATILQKLTEILENQQKMYQEYLELKRKQVELLERTQRHEYD